MKIEEEPNILKERILAAREKFAALREEDLKQVAGEDYRFPVEAGNCPKCGGLSYMLMSPDDTPSEAFCTNYPESCDFYEIY